MRPPSVKRPAEIFLEAAKPVLAKANVSLETPRARWPVAALRDVLHHLEAGTPAGLLESELWATSADAPTWWARRNRCSGHPASVSPRFKPNRANLAPASPRWAPPRARPRPSSYTVTLAVSSMIGLVLGLGDRHLDNILVDLETVRTAALHFATAVGVRSH